jgi:hypothetical protein
LNRLFPEVPEPVARGSKPLFDGSFHAAWAVVNGLIHKKLSGNIAA